MNEEKRLTEEEAEQIKARNRLKQRFGNNPQIGGKGTVRRKKKTASKKLNEDKHILSIIKKFQPQPLPDLVELNMFKDDNTVYHFKKPQVQFAMRDNFMYVNGESETKDLKDLLPDILQQVGPHQYEFLKTYAANMHNPDLHAHHDHSHHSHSHPDDQEKSESKPTDDEEIPDLVETNFEEVSKN